MITRMTVATLSIAAMFFPSAANPQTGVASTYGTSGEKTASGESLSTSALTAAHRSLPFGTRALVINKANGRSVVVRINDRGPYVGGRVIDLTIAAARALGFTGLAHVQVTSLTKSSADTTIRHSAAKSSLTKTTNCADCAPKRDLAHVQVASLTKSSADTTIRHPAAKPSITKINNCADCAPKRDLAHVQVTSLTKSSDTTTRHPAAKPSITKAINCADCGPKPDNGVQLRSFVSE